MAESQPQQYRFSVSNANLTPAQAMYWGADKHRAYVGAVGADGMEWMPVRGRMRAEAELGRGSMTGLVTSLHASFRTATVGDVLHGRVSPKELRFIAALSRLEDPNPLLTMQHRVGHSLPVVVYPNEQQVSRNNSSNPTSRRVDYGIWHPLFGGTRFQPTAELLSSWRVLSTNGNVAMDGMKSVMAKRSLDAVCFDTYHWTSERNGHVMPSWEAALPNIVADGTVQEMHICPARPDMGGDDHQLRLILDDRINDTEIGDMIACVREHKPAGLNFDVVLELPSAASGGDSSVSRAIMGAIRQRFDAAA